jgi:hypothetical protein
MVGKSVEKRINNMKYAKILCSITFALASAASGEDYVITDPMEFLHSGPEAVVEMYGKADKVRTLNDGASALAEWYLGHRVITAEFDAFGICVSYGIYRYITTREKREMIRPVKWDSQNYEFKQTNKLAIFSSKDVYFCEIGLNAVLTESSAEVSIDRATNSLYKAQVRDKQSKLR